MPGWGLAFVAALGGTLACTPLLRKIALRVAFVDRPGGHKSHLTPTPYLGGVALMAGVLIGLLLALSANPRMAVIVLSGVVLGAVGLLDDDRSLHPLFRLLVASALAAVAAAAGLQIHVTQVPAIDIAITMVWIVGITNAMNLLDNMDGLAGGVTAIAALAVLVLAVLGQQPGAAVLAAALAGASAGFLVYNRQPASIFMGDAGSLFLGYMLAVVTIDVSPSLDPPGSFSVPVMLLALPVLDTTTVTLARLRHGRPVFQGGRDHLSHRLVARGFSPGAATLLLVATETVAATLAVLAGRDMLPLAAAGLLAAALVAAVAVLTSRVPVYEGPVRGFSRRATILAGVGAAVVVLGLALTVVGHGATAGQSTGSTRPAAEIGVLSVAAGGPEMTLVAGGLGLVLIALVCLFVSRRRHLALKASPIDLDELQLARQSA